jgi:hypothetical protein
MTFQSHIYDRQHIANDTNEWPLFFLLIAMLLLGYLVTDINGTLSFTIIIMSIIGAIYYTYKDWGKKEEEGQYAGEILLTPVLFTLNHETVKTSDIQTMKIEISYTKGHKHWHSHGYTIDSGTRSSLEFTFKGSRRQYHFQIYSERQVADLKLVLEALYEKGIFVNEYYLGERTYLLAKLSYEDIQEFKKRHKLG